MHGATVLAVGYIDTLTINSNLSVVLGASGGHQHESQRDLFSVVYKPSIHIYIILSKVRGTGRRTVETLSEDSAAARGLLP